MSTSTLSTLRTLASDTKAISAELSFLKALDLLKDHPLNVKKYEILASILIRDESSSKKFNMFRINLIDWLSRNKLNNLHARFVKGCIASLQADGSILSTGVPVTLRETDTNHPHDLLFTFSTNYFQSVPFFSVRDFGTDADDADHKIASLLSHIGDKTLSFNADYWLKPVTRSLREAYENILEHAILDSSKLIRTHDNASDLIPSEYWSVEFKRFPYDTNNDVFQSLPRFSRYHSNVMSHLKRSSLHRFSYYLFITIMDDGPGIYTYYDTVARPNQEPVALTDIIEKNLSTKGFSNAGGGTIHIYRGIVSSGGYISFFCNGQHAAYYYSGKPTTFSRSAARSDTYPLRGTTLVIALPIFR